MAKTQIICTLGPATDRKSVLGAMIRKGMDVVRLNFSHGSKTQHCRRIRMVRELNRSRADRVRILGDLEGFRMRIGHLKNGKPVQLIKNSVVHFEPGDFAGTDKRISFDYQGPLDVIKNGHSIFIDDGNLALVVEGRTAAALKARVLVGGTLKERKGINLPQTVLDFHGVTKSDEEHIALCNDMKVEIIAQSFVRNAEDMIALRKRTKAKLVAKIENFEGISNIDEILKVSDGIMIARGDMGVSLPIYQVPVIQKQLIKKCRQAGKFSITATQMLESMTQNLRPTRAEVSDVANAIFDGSDYVMLSAETAVGLYPVETVDMMENILAYTEAFMAKGRRPSGKVHI